MKWMELYPKSKRPTVSDLESYLSGESMELFRQFISTLSKEMKLTYVKPVFSPNKGWYFDIGRSGVIMISEVIFDNNSFFVSGEEVSSSKKLEEVLNWAKELYNREFIVKFRQLSAERAENQKLRDARRRQREREFIEASKSDIVQDKFNIYRWTPAVRREKLKRLYESDAKGMLDSELLDEIGYTMYARCLQAKDEQVIMDQGKVKCHNCGNILNYSSGIITCQCGYQYLYKEYRRSFRKNNMPTGGAAHIFNSFIAQWPKMKDETEKMRLIDWLIHEFHINLLSGNKGRFVGINLIQGTKTQIKELIQDLAYGSEGAAEVERKNNFESSI